MCAEALPSKVLGPGAGGMWEEGLAEGLVACTKEKKAWHLRKDIYSLVSELLE